MFFIKFILLMCLALPCILGTALAESQINWGPVWDDLEGNNEFVYRTQDNDSNEAKRNCSAASGLGLKNLLNQVAKLLPTKQIEEIIKSYKDDDEIKALKAFIEDPKTIAKIKAIRKSSEYQILKDYTCSNLHITLMQLNELARSLIKLMSTRNAAEARKGIHGLMNDIDDIIPHEKIRKLYNELLASDEELAKAINHLKSDEYRQLVMNIRNNVPEYKELINQLKDLGVPVDELRRLVFSALGWSLEEF